ncbi:MAG: CHAP domain-containing protein [Rhodopirellula sp.]|nr:CHAP domain-containing protein [Rhodopirellula sp.]
MFERKPLISAVGATAVLLAMSLTATASVQLELVVHEAARAVRQQSFDKVLIVVRESSRSTTDAEIDGVLRAVEKMAFDMLEKEQGVEGVVDRKVRQAAGKIQARSPLKPSEVRRFTTLTDSAAGAVLSLDYKNRSGVSIQITLLDGVSVYFSETVELEKRPDPILEYLKDDKKSEDGAATKSTKKESAGSKNKEASKTEIKLAPGSETIKGTGGKVRRSKIESRNVRSTSQQQRQDQSVLQAVGATTDANTTGTTAPRRPPGPISEIQREVVNFAAGSIGQQIGRGECWDLADQALRAAGAEPPKGYTFGTPVPLNEIQPGDILQFTSARFDEPGYWTIMGMPNHTAVVHAVGDTRAFILQQNFDGKRYVTTYDLNLNNLTSGQLEAFRPVPRER